MNHRLHFTTQLAWYLANVEANVARDTRIRPEHLLLGVLKLVDPLFNKQLGEESIPPEQAEDLRMLAANCRQYLELSDQDITRFRRFVRQRMCEQHTSLTSTFPLLHRSPESRAIFAEALSRAQDSVTCQHLLEAIVAFDDGVFASCSEAYGRLMKGQSPRPRMHPGALSRELGIENLGTSASRADEDLILGRDKEIQQVLRCLHRSTKRSALLVGEAGIGRRTIIRGLAVHFDKRGSRLGGGCPRLLLIDGNTVAWIADSPGGKQEPLLDHLRSTMLDRSNLLFVSELHRVLCDAAKSQAASLIRQLLREEDACLLASTTATGLERIRNSGIDVQCYFNVLPVGELAPGVIKTVLVAASHRLEGVHGVSFTDEALKTALRLSDEKLPGVQPAKVMDLIENAAAFVNVSMLTSSRGQRSIVALKVTEADIRKVLAEHYGIG